MMTAITVISLGLPAGTAAYSEGMYNIGTGIFQTPLSAKGRFVFVQKISRRLLRQLVAEHQQPFRPRLARMEI